MTPPEFKCRCGRPNRKGWPTCSESCHAVHLRVMNGMPERAARKPGSHVERCTCVGAHSAECDAVARADANRRMRKPRAVRRGATKRKAHAVQKEVLK